MLPETLNYYIPIERIDREKREVIGTATAEVEDGHGTVFRYDGSKDAFTRWRGNIREMHDPHKAVGRALEITPDDSGKKIIVRAKISTGAEDTWQKVLDGTLTGFSVGGKNGKWSEMDLGGRRVPVLERYDLVELSLVDNPSCPVANVSIIRADGIASDVLAADEAEPEQAQDARGEESEADLQRAGKRISMETQTAMHAMRDQALGHAKSAMMACNCSDCQDWNASITPSDAYGEMRADIAQIVRAVKASLAEELQAKLGPSTQRVNALLARDAQRSEVPDLARRIEAQDAQLKTILDLVEKIAAQPVDGGPVLHGQAIDKHLATQGTGAQRSMSDADVIARAAELGFAPPTDRQSQINAAAALIAAQRNNAL